jgi:carbamoyl-phosphate synthase large subunit
MSLNALVLNAGRRVELVKLLRQACRGRVVAVDIDRLAPALYHADIAAPVPPVTDSDFVEHIRDLCVTHHVSLVVPTTDRELPVISRAAAELATGGVRVAVAPTSAVDACLDKLDCASMLGVAGVQTVPTCAWPEYGPPPFPFPVVVKPRRGSASDGVRVIDTSDQWTRPPCGRDWIVQPRIRGHEVTIDVLVSEHGRVVSLGARERLKVRGGEVERARTVDANAYVELAAAVATGLSLVGPFNFQVFIDGEPVVGEVNPRMGGGLPLSQHAGAMFLEELCAWAATGIWREGDPVTAREGVYMTRHDCSIFLEPQNLAWP